MSCTLYKDGEPIVSLGPSDTGYELEEYNPNSCYNIYCENNDTSSMPFIKFSGLPTSSGVHDAWNKPYWAAGGEGDCLDLAPSCSELSLTIESWRNPSPEARGTAEEAKYKCAAKHITCSDECPPQPCESKDDKFIMYYLKQKDGKEDKCETKCVKEKDFEKQMEKGYGFCPCESIPPRDIPPQSCVLKRGSQLMKFEEWPEREDVYIEIWVLGTDRIYKFTNLDTDLPEFHIDDQEIFEDLRSAQDADGIAMQFVSKNGPGGWNTCKYSPIGLDIDGSGKVERIEGEFFIDIDGSGDIEELNEWFAPTEGILLVGKENDFEDGVTGEHLLGDMGGLYTDGFHKLQEWDKNGDGIVSGNELNKFFIWVDANFNAAVDSGELHELEDYGIVGLPTTHENHLAMAELEDGGEMVMEDLWFSR